MSAGGLDENEWILEIEHFKNRTQIQLYTSYSPISQLKIHVHGLVTLYKMPCICNFQSSESQQYTVSDDFIHLCDIKYRRIRYACSTHKYSINLHVLQTAVYNITKFYFHPIEAIQAEF